MINSILLLVVAVIGAVSAVSPATLSASTVSMTLQVFDHVSFPINHTDFTITITAISQPIPSSPLTQVTLYFPNINFYIGPCANLEAYDVYCEPGTNGYVYTVDGFLPASLQPTSLLPVATVVPSDNGLDQAYLLNGKGFGTGKRTAPVDGYQVQINIAGGVDIFAIGRPNNAIPAGPQSLLPFSITYLVSAPVVSSNNKQLGTGFIDVTKFSGKGQPYSSPAGNNIRDSHVNDAFNGRVAWAWSDNSNVDKTANILNVMAVIGSYTDGTLTLSPAVQITDFAPNSIAWDTAIAINRLNTDNIVISYELLTYNVSEEITGPTSITSATDYAAVSTDGGVTWTNGPLNIQPKGESGDYRGVSADKFGNFWILATTEGALNSNRPTPFISSDGGSTWSQAYIAPRVFGKHDLYDFPQFCFGNLDAEKYGMYIFADYWTEIDNVIPSVIFIPITGLGTYGKGEIVFLNSMANSFEGPSVAASADGHFWAFGTTTFWNQAVAVPMSMVSKAPGPLSDNYAGPFIAGYFSYQAENGAYLETSVPTFGTFPSSQDLIYDDARQALYAMYVDQSAFNLQDSRLVLIVSRNNGHTWSAPYELSSSTHGNRFFPTMALDPSTGALFVGWYDGRADPTDEQLQYYSTFVSSADLDALVAPIPLSDPIYAIPNQGQATPLA